MGWLMALLLAAVPITLHNARWAQKHDVANRCLRLMAFQPTNAAAVTDNGARLFAAFWLVLHGVGLLALVSLNRWPWWIAPLAIALILLPQFWHPPFALGQSSLVLSPLLLVYACSAVRIGIGTWVYATTGQFAVPEPWSTLFNPTLVFLAMAGYALVLSVWSTGIAEQRFVKRGASVLIALALIWALWTAGTLRTHGVSGSDPYAYMQMGVDLVTQGTVFHPFPLVRHTFELGIPSAPVVHIGYKLPQDITRTATTVWPPGYAVFTGLAYRAGGEMGVYWLAPVLSVLALLVLAWLALQVLGVRCLVADTRYPIAALAVFFTATSYQQVEWQLIPMADIGAQLFSLLALALALIPSSNPKSAPPPFPIPSTNSGRRLHSLFLIPPPAPALAGLCLGIAFGVRYTQVLIAPALALALWQSPLAASVARRLRSVLVCALFAALAAAPTLVYHAVAFGNPFATGSDELQHFSLVQAPQTLWRTVQAMLWYREFGLLAPFVLIGGVVLWRLNKSATLALLAYLVALSGFHALYTYLRQRDLLSVFPVLYLFAAVGVVAVVQWLVQQVRGRGDVETRKFSPHLHIPAPASRYLCIALLVLTSCLTLQRSIETMILPITRGYDAFGYLVREQRQSFAHLATLIPPEAVVASSLNSGAIDLHAQRLAFRPSGWTSQELQKFVRALRDENTPVFFLDDGQELTESLATLRTHFRVVEVAQLDVPYYFPNSGGSENRRVPLYKIE
jgi:hypothetical protein